ncbi:MAG: tRNA uridine-5-carboxymethylaminomethyl(34) synthesis enzyme MnmG [Campylobacterota bacterium]
MEYDVIVIGGGHAGSEAALASAKMGKKTLLLTILAEQVAASSCNPAIGGLAKGHLVKELDALGGMMGVVTDKTGLQFRLLNASKGPAVRGSRAQIDMDRYRIMMRDIILKQSNLELVQEMVAKLLVDDSAVTGVQTQMGNSYYAKKVIITTGTFLDGKIHIGSHQQSAGRAGEFASIDLSRDLKEIGFEVGRLKTGTCARLDGDTIDFSVMEKHYGDENPVGFSFKSREFNPPNIPCHITYTNEKTHRLIESNFHQAPLFTGQIDGMGPRYCPSIEDKVNRFKERHRHQLFVEPQTLEANEYYINGLSTSLPPQVQREMIASIKGLENAKIVRYGYAIEYDFVQPTELKHTLETKKIANLYLAGQINGTTGYEEAAAQGLMAGINAVLAIDAKEPFVLRRDEAYIGVLIDDLVTKGTNEPYRMFTSRAEFRLLLREDNAIFRLGDYGYSFGLIDEAQMRYIHDLKEKIDEGVQRLKTTYQTPNKETLALLQSIGEDKITDKTFTIDVIGRGNYDKQKLLKLLPQYAQYEDFVIEQILVEAKYFRYIQKQKQQVDRLKSMLNIKIPDDFEFKTVSGLSSEIIEKLEKFNPPTLQAASQISGVTPAALEIIHIYLKMRGDLS